MKTQRTGGMMAAGIALAIVALAATARAADWQTDGNGNWNDAGNWNGGVPNAVGATASFTNDITADRTVTLDVAPTVGNMFIGDNAATYYNYTLSGANTLTFDDSDATAGLTVSRGTNNVVSAPVSLTDKLKVEPSNASRIEFSGQLSGAGQLEVGPSGTESPPNTYVRLSGNNSSYAAGIRLLGGANAQSPKLQIAHTNALGSGTIEGVNYYGGWLENVTGSTLTLANNISGTEMAFAGNDFILNGTINLTGASSCSIRANVTVANGFASDVKLDAGGLTVKTLKLLSSSVGDITSVSSGNLRLELWNDGALGTDYTQSVGGGAMTLVAANGPRTIAKNFTAGWAVDGSGTLTLTGNTSGYQIQKDGAGLLVLNGNNSGVTGLAYLNNGVMRLASANALPPAHLYLGNGSANPAILELTPQYGDFTNAVATSGANKISWNNSGDGGFSAYGGNRLVNLGGASATQQWNASTGFMPAQKLILNSVYADSVIEFQNPIDLNCSNDGDAQRTIWVNDNPNTNTDYAVMSGVLLNSGNTRGIIKDGSGLLVLTATNTYNGATTVKAGTLAAGHSNAFSTAGTITVNSNATLAVAAGVTFAPGARTMTFNAGAILAGQGTYNKANSWTNPAGLTLKPGLPAGTLTVDVGGAGKTLTLGASNVLQAVIQSDSVTYGKLAVNGALDISAATARLVVSGKTPTASIVLAEGLSLTGTFQAANVDLTGLSKPAQVTYTATQILLGPTTSGTLIMIN